MKKFTKLLFAITFLLLGNSTLKAQVVFVDDICGMKVTAQVSQNINITSSTIGEANVVLSGGTAPFSYLWSNGATTSSISNLPAGSYTVSVKDADGCVGFSTVKIGVSDALGGSCVASFTYSQTTGTTVDFTSTSTGVNGNTSYFWDFGDGNFSNSANPSNAYTSPGFYTVCLTISDSAVGCFSTFCDTSFQVLTPASCQASFTYSQTQGTILDVVSTSTGVNGNTSYFWDFGDGQFGFTPNASNTYANAGTYMVCLTISDSSGCNSTFCDTVQILPLGISEQTQESFTLFPNPTSNEINIRSTFNMVGNEYKILDVTGREVLIGEINGKSIHVNLLEKGMYILQIENSKGVISAQRFMKD